MKAMKTSEELVVLCARFKLVAAQHKSGTLPLLQPDWLTATDFN